MSKIVVALGGNALSSNGKASAADQQAVALQTARSLTSLIDQGHQVAIVHGNGPQIGNIILHEEAINTEKTPTMPIDTCGAMSQGMIGYWLQNAIGNVGIEKGRNYSVASVITQTMVDPEDPAFDNPTKPIGPFYSEDEAKDLIEKRGFVMKEDAGRGWRRVVPSPRPTSIVEAEMVKKAIDGGSVVVTAGGGGIPVYKKDGKITGLEAVIDKDFAAEKLAELIEADYLLILTAVDAVKINYNTESETSIHKMTVDEAKDYIDQGQFAPGSMLPKIEASISFVKSGAGRQAIITNPDSALLALDGESGTKIIA